MPLEFNRRRPIRAVTIEAEPPQPIEVDGDPLPAGRLEAPGGLDAAAPDPASEPVAR
jgi:hypothetical protein